MKKFTGVFLYYSDPYRWVFGVLLLCIFGIFSVYRVFPESFFSLWDTVEVRKFLISIVAPILFIMQIVTLRSQKELFLLLPLGRKALQRYRIFLIVGATFFLSLICYLFAFFFVRVFWIWDFLLVNLFILLFVLLIQSSRLLSLLILKHKVLYVVIVCYFLSGQIFPLLQYFFILPLIGRMTMLALLLVVDVFLLYLDNQKIDKINVLRPKQEKNHFISSPGEWKFYLQTLFAFWQKSALFLGWITVISVIYPFLSLSRLEGHTDRFSIIFLTSILSISFSSLTYILKVPYQTYKLPFLLPTDRKKPVIINYALELLIFFLFFSYLFLLVQIYHLSWSDMGRAFSVYGFTRIFQLFIEWMLLINSHTTTFEGRYIFATFISSLLAAIPMFAHFNPAIVLGIYAVCFLGMFVYSLRKVYSFDFQ